MPLAKLFRSRWSALLWSGGVLWMAYDVAGAAPADTPPSANATTSDVTGTPVSADDLAVLAHFGDGSHR